MQGELISVIVPVYEVEKYLHRSLDSVINQTYRNLEIILVDDGSPDACPQICDAYASEDVRINVIHKRNGGLSDARNVGLDISRGEFIFFLDSDDYLEVNALARMKMLQCKYDADVVSCNYCYYYDSDGSTKINPTKAVKKVTVLYKESILERYFIDSPGDMIIACGKLYRKKLFFSGEIIKYPVGRLHEDNYTTYRLLDRAEKMVITDEPLLYYVQRQGSIMATMTRKRAIDIVEYYLEIFAYINDGRHTHLEKIVRNYVVNHYFSRKLDWNRDVGCRQYLPVLAPLEDLVNGIDIADVSGKQKVKLLLDRLGLLVVADKIWRRLKSCS